MNKNGERLDEKRALLFYCLVTNLLFGNKRPRPDIQPIILLLTTRVCETDEYDWKKLGRLLQYLYSTSNNYMLHINAANLNVVHWWVDASYGMHDNLKGHTGAKVSLGKGCVRST